MTWINVKRMLPKRNEMVITYSKKHKIGMHLLSTKKTFVYHFTHWMPYPETPIDVKEITLRKNNNGKYTVRRKSCTCCYVWECKNYKEALEVITQQMEKSNE